ncbi:hypothetical protein N9563_00265, partial [bacterium]|nr:hypothetical protein [bacterium]
ETARSVSSSFCLTVPRDVLSAVHIRALILGLVAHVVTVHSRQVNDHVTRNCSAQALNVTNIGNFALLRELITHLQVDDFEVLLLQ